MASIPRHSFKWLGMRLSLYIFVCMFTFRIYSCSNSTITHAQNLCTRCVYVLRVATCACRSSTSMSRSAWVSVENKNKPVSLPIVVTMCTVGGRLYTYYFFWLEKCLRSFNLSLFFKPLLLPQEYTSGSPHDAICISLVIA